MTEIKKRRGRPPKVKPQTEAPAVDWEQLSKRLQEALTSSIEENKVLFNDNCKLVADNRNLMSIVKYLESRLDRTYDPV
jgi:hypothetical protein